MKTGGEDINNFEEHIAELEKELSNTKKINDLLIGCLDTITRTVVYTIHNVRNQIKGIEGEKEDVTKEE